MEVKKDGLSFQNDQDDRVKWGIRVKLMGMFAVLIGLPLIILGFMMFNQSGTMLKENLKQTSVQAVGQTNQIIENYIKEFSFVTRLIESNPAAQNILADPAAQNNLVGFFDMLVKTDPDIMNAYMGVADKRMLIKPDQALPAGYDPTGRGWYKKAVATGDLIWTSPYPDSATGKMVVTVAMPVKNNGQVVGVVALDVSLDTLAKKINQLKIGETGYVYMLDSETRIMTHPSKEFVGLPLDEAKALADDPKLLTNLTDEQKKGYEIVKNSTGLKDGVLKGEGFFEYKKNGKDAKYGVVQKNQLGWYVVGSYDAKEISGDIDAILRSLEIIGGVALIIAIMISFWFSKTLTDSIKRMLDNMKRIRGGDLTVTFDEERADELGKLSHYFTETIQELARLVRSIQDISGEVTHSAQNLAATSEETSASADEVARTVNEIARGASEQAQDAERGVQVVQALSEKFTQLNQRTTHMIEAAQNVTVANKDGIKTVEQLKEKTRMTDSANERIEGVITELDNKTQSIAAILDSISAIAVQTNLLALNASIEAARAGEHGRGFAVVAEEIRKLAEESSSAADEIRVIVTNITADSTRTVSSMKEVKEISKEQSNAVEAVNLSFGTISESISGIAKEIEVISQFVTALNTDKDQIVQSIENISAVSEETAAAAEEVSASMDQQTMAVEEVAKAAERLNEISVELNSAAKRFKV